MKAPVAFHRQTAPPTTTGTVSRRQSGFVLLCGALFLTLTFMARGQTDDRLVGIWALDEGFQVSELLLRSDGRYQLETHSSDPVLDFSSTEGGRYEVSGPSLFLKPYEFFGEPQSKRYGFEVSTEALSLTHPESGLIDVYQFKAGSKAEVLAGEKVPADLVGTWSQTIKFVGKYEYTFRPDGYYFQKKIPEDSQFSPEYIRGRYVQEGARLTLKPYRLLEAQYEIDFYGKTLTLIDKDEFSGHSATYQKLPNSGTEVRAKAAEAEAFLGRANWQVGVWDIRDDVHTVTLTIRPDGHYSSTNDVEILRGMVRGRYSIESRLIHFFPFVGQGLYSRDNGDFGKVERTRELDYYDGELQLIDLESISQSVAIARLRPGSDVEVLEKTRQAQAERARDGWFVGVWEVNDPTGWMEFTFRPDNRYIAKSGTDRVPSQVERGQFVWSNEKATLAPYSGLGPARGFEVDRYDGDLFLVGDLGRMVIARKVSGSETDVMEKTRHPEAMRGERGSILGLWTANMPGQSAELVFRPDGEFRLRRCSDNVVSEDYGLYSVDMATRTLVYDSRFVQVQTQGLDFYGNTLTIYGGLGAPRTYTVNLGTVDAAIVASLAADAAEAQVDAQWLARIPVGPRDPNAVQVPTGEIPADPNPGRIFPSPTVFSHFQFYRRLISGLVFFNVQGTIKSVPVVNTSEWYFFPTGRVLVRFKNYHAGVSFPDTIADVTSSWGAYRIEGKPTERDILHLYAENALFMEMANGDKAEMTLEDGRRHLFWDKDYQILSEWAAEQKPVPCQPPANGDGSLANTGVSLSTTIQPDPIGDARPMQIRLSRPVTGQFTLSGTSETARTLTVERTTSLAAPVVWEPLQTNSVPAGAFSFSIPGGPAGTAYFRVR